MPHGKNAKKRPSDLRLRRRGLRLRRRREEPNLDSSSWSLFARLPPSVVATLQTDALCRAQSLQEDEDDIAAHAELGWSIASSSSAGEQGDASSRARVEFLPLSVKFSPNETIYVSYNGGGIADAKDGDNILELPASLVLEGFHDDTLVQVAALAAVKDADMLNVEPLTTEDWELLETRAEFLENGALLQQISVVYSDQVIKLWVGGKDFASIRVLHENFGGDGRDAVWPECLDSSKRDNMGPAQNCCLRLVRDTRICVTPKPRCNKAERTTRPSMRVYPTMEDYSKPMNDLVKRLGKTQVSTTPGTVYAHRKMREKIPGLNQEDQVVLVIIWNADNGPDINVSDSNQSCAVQLSFCDDVPEFHLAVHRLTRSRLQLIALVDTVYVRVLSPIEVARGSTLLSQFAEDNKKPIALELVQVHEARKGAKWRFPHEEINERKNQWSPFQSVSGSENIFDLSSVEADEPIENGSFLFTKDSSQRVKDGCKVYRVTCSAEIASTCLIEPSNSVDQSDNKTPSDRGFIFRTELQQIILMDIPAKPVTYELLSSTQLLNLLPETSLVSPSLLELVTKNSDVADALVFGGVGSGKTHTAMVLAAIARINCGCSTFYLDCKALKEGRGIRMKHIVSELNQLFREAASCKGKSVVCLDGLDEVAPNLQSATHGNESAQSHQVNPVAVDQAKLLGDTVRRLLGKRPDTSTVSVIITCQDKMSLHPAILTARPFTRTVSPPTLDSFERECLLWKMILAGDAMEYDDIPDELRSLRIGRKTDGFRPRDLQLLASRVRHLLLTVHDESSLKKLTTCVSKALDEFVPLRQLTVNEGTVGAVEWSNIGGLFRVKDALASTILNPAKYRRIYEKARIRLPRGVLVFGYPGCGKSYLVPALAKKCGFSLITCRGPELLDRYIGASESKVRELFARAAAASPSILFFDEIDSLAPRRGSDRTGVTDRVVNQLLTLLDGVEDASASGLVYIVAATSRPDIVDPALLRPGRLEKHVYVGFPENDEEFTDLWMKIASRYCVDADVLELIASGDLVREFKSSSTKYYRLSAADLNAVFDTAQLNAIHELLQRDRSDEKLKIGRHQLIAALHSTRPSLPQRDYEMFLEAYRPYHKDLKGQAGDGDSASGTFMHSRKLRTALR